MLPDFAAMDHQYFMREALSEARIAAETGELPIGVVLVHNGNIVARGHVGHVARVSKIAHAEMDVLTKAEKYLESHPHECVIYSTVEPCVMCLGAIVMANVSHVVFALQDNWIKPSEMLRIDYVRQHVHEYVGGVLAGESLDLWRRFCPQDIPMLLEGKRPR